MNTRVYKRRLKRDNSHKEKLRAARALSFMMHDKVHLTFGQCVQVLLTNYQYDAWRIANRSIEKQNAAENDVAKHIALFDHDAYMALFSRELDFAMLASFKKEDGR
jgi:hypothetical protein